MAKYLCKDRMCGATDCHTCYPGNHEGETCGDCLQEYDSCECEEFSPEDFDEPDDDSYQENSDDYWDEVSNQYEKDIGY